MSESIDPASQRILARMLEDRGKFWSARELQSDTMQLRKLTEIGMVTMSLSKRGIPHYQISDDGEVAVISDW